MLNANSLMNIDTTNRTASTKPASAVDNSFTVRYATLSDADEIDTLLVQAFGSTAPRSSVARDIENRNNVYIVVTTDAPTEQSKRDQLKTRQRGWTHRVKSMFSRSRRKKNGAQDSGFLAGVVGIWMPVDQAHIVVIASRPSERGRGVGELLMIATIAEAMSKGAMNATLEVRKSNNVARSLYRKYGFSDVGMRHRYYADNREDAVIMSTPVLSDFGYQRSLNTRYQGYCANRGEPNINIPNPLTLPLP